MDALKSVGSKLYQLLDRAAGDPTPAARKRNLQFIAWLAVMLDSKFVLPFAIPILGKHRFGLQPMLDLVPYGGATLCALVSAYLIYLSLKFDLPTTTLVRMAIWTTISLSASYIPFLGWILGTLFDTVAKPNIANLRLLSDHLSKEDKQVVYQAEVEHAGETVATATRSAPPPPPPR
ncbi:hypothetical protein DFJ74DRAFT_93343 [Hyaloraphidium curvatum]|nr:hypothetical protein DFJ74DRAFT_93343 [Hyaloraphidium curvatum]